MGLKDRGVGSWFLFFFKGGDQGGVFFSEGGYVMMGFIGMDLHVYVYVCILIHARLWPF